MYSPGDHWSPLTHDWWRDLDTCKSGTLNELPQQAGSTHVPDNRVQMGDAQLVLQVYDDGLFHRHHAAVHHANPRLIHGDDGQSLLVRGVRIESALQQQLDRTR